MILQTLRDHAEIDISGLLSIHASDGRKEIISNDPPVVEIDLAKEKNSEEINKDDISDTLDDEPEMPKTTRKVVTVRNIIADQKSFPVTDKKPARAKYAPVEFRIDDKDGRLSVRFTGYYNKEWIAEIRTYGKIYYDKVHREFLLKWSKMNVDSLSDYFSSKGVEVIVIRQQLAEKVREKRKNSGDEVRSRELSACGFEGLELLRQYLEENRYSSRTVETYITLLELFFKFYNDKDPYSISQNEVSDFMNDFIIRNGFSGSYQNQMISTIKLFYEVSGKGRVIPQILERPRRGRSLPKVFSKEEISRILNSTRNNKHKLLLWIIYSCGLRRSEVTNILLTDIDRTRNLLHIREGTGGVDRIVPVSDKVWQKLDEYVEGYKPQRYLFEGQTGGRYSSESVYNVFKQALQKAGIKKEVGVHSLRHSYATHLHENGLDIRFIQELLGHKSTRTTEIYTHVSRRNLVAVRSPIDDLDLK
jgi:integrase/recombinase XerD